MYLDGWIVILRYAVEPFVAIGAIDFERERLSIQAKTFDIPEHRTEAEQRETTQAFAICGGGGNLSRYGYMIETF